MADRADLPGEWTSTVVLGDGTSALVRPIEPGDAPALNEFHLRHNNDGTIAVAHYEVAVPYGVVQHGAEGEFAGIQEKPVFNHFVAAGIYCLSPAYRALVTGERPMDMPDLLALGRQVGLQAGLFPIHEYWRDIGQPGDLEEAVADHSVGEAKS